MSLLTYQEYISQNYVEIKKGDGPKPYISNYSLDNWGMTNNMLNITMMNDRTSLIIKNDCTMIIGWSGSARGMCGPSDVSNYTNLGLKEYNKQLNIFKLNQIECYTAILYIKIKKGQTLLGNDYYTNGFNFPQIILIFDNFIYTSELDYNKHQKQQEQKIIYEKEQIINKRITKLEESIIHLLKNNYNKAEINKLTQDFSIEKKDNQLKEKLYNDKYILLNTLIGIEQREKVKQQNKIEQLEQENLELKERLKRIEEKIFAPIEHKYF